MERITNYLKNNPSAIDALKILLLENIEYPVITVLYEAVRDLEDEINETHDRIS